MNDEDIFDFFGENLLEETEQQETDEVVEFTVNIPNEDSVRRSEDEDVIWEDFGLIGWFIPLNDLKDILVEIGVDQELIDENDYSSPRILEEIDEKSQISIFNPNGFDEEPTDYYQTIHISQEYGYVYIGLKLFKGMSPKLIHCYTDPQGPLEALIKKYEFLYNKIGYPTLSFHYDWVI